MECNVFDCSLIQIHSNSSISSKEDWTLSIIFVRIRNELVTSFPGLWFHFETHTRVNWMATHTEKCIRVLSGVSRFFCVCSALGAAHTNTNRYMECTHKQKSKHSETKSMLHSLQIQFSWLISLSMNVRKASHPFWATLWTKCVTMKEVEKTHKQTFDEANSRK